MTSLLNKALVALAAAVCALPVPVHAADYPSKPVRIILPYAAAGASDVLARGFASRLADRLGQQVIIDNRGGSGGAIGTAAAVRSDPDGYTLLMQSGSVAMELAMKKKLPYNTRKDLVPIILLARGPFAILVNTALPVNSVGELIAYAKKYPGKLNFGSSGVASSIHMSSELFKAMAGIDAVHVAYQGMAPAYTALIAGDIQFVIDPLATARRFADGGRARALAVTTQQKTPMWPELPTVGETVAGYESWVWYALFAPAGTPQAVIDKVNAEANAVLAARETRDWLMSQGFDAVGGKPEDVTALVESEALRWEKLIRDAALKFE